MSRQSLTDSQILEMFSRDTSDQEHPSEDRWIEYQSGQLPAAERESLQAHLAACQACADFVLAIDAFAAEPSQLPEVGLDEVASGWQELSRRLASESTAQGHPEAMADLPAQPPVEALPVPAPALGNGLWTPRVGFGLAAALLLVVLGLLGLRDRDLDRLAELQSWKALEEEVTTDFGLHSINPWGTTRSPGDVAEVRGGDVLILYVGGFSERISAPVLEVRDSTGNVVSRLTDLGNLADGILGIRLPKAALPVGRYELHLRFGDNDTLITRYKIHLISAENP